MHESDVRDAPRLPRLNVLVILFRPRIEERPASVRRYYGSFAEISSDNPEKRNVSMANRFSPRKYLLGIAR